MHRHSIRLPHYDYASSGWYFVTICTQGREHVFGHVHDGKMHPNAFGEIVLTEWYETMIMRPNVSLDAFCVMPNHVHGIISITFEFDPNCRGVLQYAPTFVSPSQTIGSIVRGLKSAVTKHINATCQTPGAPVWQRNYYEHVIRNETDLHRIRAYIQNNPSNWQNDELNEKL